MIRKLTNHMFQSFFKTAFRYMALHKGFSFINIAGLTLGLTACILIGLFVQDEYLYDKFIPGGDRIYRIYDHFTSNEETADLAVGSPMITPTLLSASPEVESAARVMMLPKIKRLFEIGKIKSYEQSGYFVDSSFFKVFEIPFTHGTPFKSLDNSSSIILSQDLAERFFGPDNPLGKQLLVDKQSFIVNGVFKKNAKFHLLCDYIMPLAAAQVPADRMQSWGWQQFYNYAKLKPGTDVQALQKKFQELVDQRSKAFLNDSRSSNKMIFQPLKDIHLHSANFKFDVEGRGNITYVRALTVIAGFILLIACFNFVNLATAKSLQRAKEVGVRKSIGASKKQLLLQFTGETVLFSGLSLILSTGLVILLLPWLNRFTDKQIGIFFLTNPAILAILVVLGVVTGIAAGFYPAVVLSSFKPVIVLKENASYGKTRSSWLRHALVVSQFTLSALLIISAMVVFNQVGYLHHKDLGFNREEIMFFPMRGEDMFKNTDAFKNQLLQAPGVTAVSIGYGFPGDAVAGDEVLQRKNGKWEKQFATQLMVDYDYIKTLGLNVIAGRGFLRQMATDKDKAFIINETAVRQLGFGTPAKAIGQELAWNPWGARNPDSLKIGTVIGVVKDFNYKSLYDKVELAVLQIFPHAAWKVAVKLKTSGIENSIKAVEKVWSQFSPEYPLEYNFMDENFVQMYKAEDKLKVLVEIFTCIAIFVGCLGLFGLAAYTAERRKKEVGIRKVLGASTQGIVLLLSKSFLLLDFISLIIASPIAWLAMHVWLQNFAYRIVISWWIFFLAAAIALVIALFTVAIQAVKAAFASPVKNLRTE
jgi:putative ABC transport system permease protein